uniref:Uncharacterized protein C10orf118 n=3 Tax=Lygus hesperus TaxID=30085 RepID=A0A146KSE2_LYGHE
MVQMALQHEPPVDNALKDVTQAGEKGDGDRLPTMKLEESASGLLVELAAGSSGSSSPDLSPSVVESPASARSQQLNPTLVETLLLDDSADVFSSLPPPITAISSTEVSSSPLPPAIIDVSLSPLPVISPQSEHDCLQHPTHISFVDRLDASKNTISNLEDTIKRLEERVSLESEKIEKYELLEQTVAQQEKELDLCRQEHEIDIRTINSLKSEMEGKISALKKQCDSANKEKEGMVMRYAKNEKELLDQKKARENLEKKVKEVTKDNEALQAKLKALGAEKAKVSQLLETKNTEVSNAYKEIDKLKDDINSRDIKIKWTQSKLKSEMEDHKECPGMIEKLGQTVKLLEEELDSLKKENLTLQRQLDGSEVNKNIESQLKEHQAKLIMEKHERSELEAKFKELQSKQASLVEENENLSSQVLSLEQERLVATKKVNSLKEERTVLTDKLSQLQENLKEMGHLKEQLKEEREKLILTSTEMERLRKSNEDLAADMSSCRHREAEMLAFTQQLTVKNVQLQSEFSAVEEKASELEKEEVVLEQTSASLKDELEQVKAKLKEEQTKRHEEARLLARQVAEKTTKSLNLEALLTDTQSELNLLRQKHTTALKELQKELHLYRKRVDQLECNGGGSSASGSDSVCQGSRTSSLSSLNDSSQSPYQVLDVPAHTLIERIVKLQNDCAKQTERIEFLEEHTAHLVKELQKKSKLLQNYIMREQTGALTSKVMDRNKAEVSKHGGIMASLYSTKPSESMTLELSMEINRKLQAVLEDTLLKNITLKENLDTLGDEIARLSHKKS